MKDNYGDETLVRAAFNSTYGNGVDLIVFDQFQIASSRSGYATAHFSPDAARKLAKKLKRAAKEAEAK